MSVPILSAQEFGTALAEAGVISTMDRVTRIVIDAKVGDVVTLYVERTGDSRLLQVIPALTDVRIERVP